MKKLAQHWQILIALLLATGMATVFRNVTGNLPEDSWGYIGIMRVIGMGGFVGGLFIQALKMIIVPLVVSAIISGIAGLSGVEGFGRLGLKTVGFYMGSSLLAILVWLALVNAIQP